LSFLKNQEIQDVRRIRCYLPLFLLALLCASLANAQSGFDIGVGFGASQAPAATTGITTDLNSCALGTAGCQATPNLNSFMIGFRGELMAWEKFGIGGQVNMEPLRKDYVVFPPSQNFSYALQSRVTLYDVNGIYAPIRNERVQVKLQGGLGAANIKFYEAGSSTTALVGTQRFSQFFGSSNHFQVHAGAGVQIYPTGGAWWIRPEFDLHYVRNFTQFGRNAVLRGSVWIGYTLGR
jgi:hypothetical protein